jgi:hypothetical protein
VAAGVASQAGKAACATASAAVDVGDAGLDHLPDDFALIGRRTDWPAAGANTLLAANQRRGEVVHRPALLDGLVQVL